MFYRAPKLDGIGLKDTDSAGDGVYESAVHEVARLRSAYEDRKPPSVLGSDHSGFFDDAQLQAGIARSLLDGNPAEAKRLKFAGQPYGVVDLWRTMAYALAGGGAGGDDVSSFR